MDEITEFLYISGIGPVLKENIDKFGITVIVDAANLSNKSVKGVETIKIELEDFETSNLKHYFDIISDKIKRVKNEKGKVLVHCAAGISRSATLCIAYFVKHENLTLKNAYEKVFLKRSVISPNSEFWKQLIEYEKEIRGANSVTMIKRSYDEVPDLYLTNSDLYTSQL